MKALVFHGIGDIRLEDVPEPRIEQPTDAIVRITANSICGTDLHLIRGTAPGMRPGTILGHEAVGYVEQVGPAVRNFRPGDRVLISPTIACGYCSYCRDGYFAQCDNANPNGPLAGTAFFGGPEISGPFQGLHAEKARIPFANVGLFKLPSEQQLPDEQAILLADVFPTGYFGAELAEVEAGDTVAVFGCGPVGQFAIAGAKQLGAGRVLAVDTVPARLDMARSQGAEVIDFNAEDPVESIRSLTGGIGVDRAIDAVGVDANRPHAGPAATKLQQQTNRFEQELREIAAGAQPATGTWHPGDAPSLVGEWIVQSLAKAGTFSVIGYYPSTDRFFPFGMAMNKNLTVKMGNCNHRRYYPMLLELMESGAVDTSQIVRHVVKPMRDIIEAYRAFDEHQAGWEKVELVAAA